MLHGSCSPVGSCPTVIVSCIAGTAVDNCPFGNCLVGSCPVGNCPYTLKQMCFSLHRLWIWLYG